MFPPFGLHVSIPLRYAKNEAKGKEAEIGFGVSIPLRYAKNYAGA